MTNKLDFNIPDYCSSIYSTEDYTYIKIHFINIIYMERKYIIPIQDSAVNNYDGEEELKSCYFIFCPLNWFNKHDVRINSNYSSKEWGPSTVNNEFSYDLYKKNVVDNLLVAVLDNKDNLIEFNDNSQKEKIGFNLINYAVEKLIQLSIKKRPYRVDLEELSRKTYLYNRHNLLSSHGKSLGGQAPSAPAALILKSLAERYPHKSTRELMFFDDQILQMFDVIDSQEVIKQHESRTINENISFTNVKRNINNDSKIPGFNAHKNSTSTSGQMNKNQINKKLLSKLEDISQFRKT